MQDLIITFARPWLLLLIVAAVGLSLLGHFLTNKKFRKTRNRIISLVLHILTISLVIILLSGVELKYRDPNEDNEIILLVDVSDTENQSKDTRDEFIKTILADSRYSTFKIGVVTFGYDQVYAVPLTYDVDKIFETYQSAELPDCSATDIASAITFAKGLFDKPQTAKIVLITDGKQTDNSAISVINAVVAQGTRLDAAYISSDYPTGDVQVTGIDLPEFHVVKDEECTLTVNLYSNFATTAKVTLFDNGQEIAEGGKMIDVAEGSQSVMFNHAFTSTGMHSISAEISQADDYIEENDVFYTYFYLETYDNILILEHTSGESEKLKAILEEGDFKVTVKNIYSGEGMPETVDDLRQYDQIILNNISNADLTNDTLVDDFDSMIYSYVYDYGGGLFTVGGNDDVKVDANGNPVANAYNRKDMYGTLYQSMLPVQVVDYTPPLGLVVIIDASGSMSSTSGETGLSKFEWAKEGAKSCLNELSDRDYMGVMLLSNSYSTAMQLTPCSQKDEIRNTISNLEAINGGTVFAPAIKHAGEALRNLKTVDKKHIIIVTDGEAFDYDDYMAEINNFYNDGGITVSFVFINPSPSGSTVSNLENAAEAGHGKLTFAGETDIVPSIREDVSMPAMKEVVISDEGLYPVINKPASAIFNGIETGEGADRNRMTVPIRGFYGTRAKNNDVALLVGDYEVPVYAQWKFGNGTVGSFMCDLNGVWSADLIADANGKKLILNAVTNIMPTHSIRPEEMNVVFEEDNYTNRLNVFTPLAEGERIEGTIINADSGQEFSLNEVSDATSAPVRVDKAFSAENNYSKCIFVVNGAGAYEIRLTRYGSDGEVAGEYSVYKTFSYSEEYLLSAEENTSEILGALAGAGNGTTVSDLSDPVEIFDDFIPYITTTYDPRMVILVSAMVLFLLDLIVRKFKFKWIHELVAEHKNKAMNKNRG